MLFVWYKFRHVERNNIVLCSHLSNLSLVRIQHLLMTQQNAAVSNFCSTNCSGAPSVVWNPHFILIHLVKLKATFYEDGRKLLFLGGKRPVTERNVVVSFEPSPRKAFPIAEFRIYPKQRIPLWGPQLSTYPTNEWHDDLVPSFPKLILVTRTSAYVARRRSSIRGSGNDITFCLFWGRPFPVRRTRV